jgi:hypothetical protein
MSPYHFDSYLDRPSMEKIGFGVTGLKLVGVMPAVQGCCLVQCFKPAVSYHTQIKGPVHGAATHENRTTMSLYGYDLTQYVVEFSLGVPTGCAGKL